MCRRTRWYRGFVSVWVANELYHGYTLLAVAVQQTDDCSRTVQVLSIFSSTFQRDGETLDVIKALKTWPKLRSLDIKYSLICADTVYHLCHTALQQLTACCRGGR